MLQINCQNAMKIASGALISVTIIYCGKIWVSYRFFKKRRIQTPEYSYVLGNMPEIDKKNYSEALKEWTEKYGKTYGFYEGHLPVLVTSDINIIQEVFFKQQANFMARKMFSNQYADDSTNLFLSSRHRWKRIRNIISPTFSPSKLKELVPLIRKCSDRLIEHVEERIAEKLNVSELFDSLAMDVVWNCAFGVDIDCQNRVNNPFLINTASLFQNLCKLKPLYLILTYFYEIKPFINPLIDWTVSLLAKLSYNSGNPLFWTVHQIHQVVEKRIENKVKRKDYVQILVDAQRADMDGHSERKDFDPNFLIETERKLSYDEITINLIQFLLGGLDTTSATLSFCLYALCKHPEEMRKLQEEIDSFVDDVNLDYEKANKLKYMDMFIKEVQRMYSVSNSFITRRCTKSTTVNGLEVPEGLVVALDVLSLHYSEEHWINPYSFQPERFTSENKINKLAYVPFGMGTRMCVGMQFALLEIKLTLIKILKSYDVLPAFDVKNSLEVSESSIGEVRKFKHGITCTFKRRIEIN